MFSSGSSAKIKIGDTVRIVAALDSEQGKLGRVENVAQGLKEQILLVKIPSGETWRYGSGEVELVTGVS